MQRSDPFDNPTLRGLLARGSRFGPEYQHGLSNHLPMALIALAGLGAKSPQLESFFDEYAIRLEVAALSGSHRSSTNIRYGDINAYPSAVIKLREQVASEGCSVVLKRALRSLGPGIGAAAFHGMLRTAYGVLANNDEEIIAGLAYWGARHLPIKAAMPVDGQIALQPWLDRLQRNTRHLAFDLPLIHHNMAAMAKTQEWRDALPDLDMTTVSVEALARIAAQSYLRQPDFIVLHLITSAHAMQTLLPMADDQNALIWSYTLAYAAALPFTPMIDGFEPTRSSADRDMSRAMLAARLSNDDHVAKLVYSCHALATARQSCSDSGLYVAVANSVTGEN